MFLKKKKRVLIVRIKNSRKLKKNNTLHQYTFNNLTEFLCVHKLVYTLCISDSETFNFSFWFLELIGKKSFAEFHLIEKC